MDPGFNNHKDPELDPGFNNHKDPDLTHGLKEVRNTKDKSRPKDTMCSFILICYSKIMNFEDITIIRSK